MKARKIYWAFLLVFLIAAIWLQTTGALGEAFWGLYGIIIAGFFVGGVFVNRRYLQDLEKEVKEMNPLLEQEPDKYIDAMEKALQGQRSRAMQAMLLTQIGKGYMAKGDYETEQDRIRSLRIITIFCKSLPWFPKPIVQVPENIWQSIRSWKKEKTARKK